MTDKYTVTTGTNLNYDSDATWQPISIRNALFSWTASGSGTGEYYLRTAGGADPSGVLTGLVEPANVQANGTALTAGTAGSLAASSWDWADNDTLGYSTIYVRLSDDADPDSKTDGFVTFTDSPNANDNVFFVGAASINGGNFSTTELDDIVFLPGHTGSVGSNGSPLVLDKANADKFEFHSTGTIHISVGDAATDAQVYRTGSASNGQAGLYLHNCSALTTLNVRSGTVKLVSSSCDDAFVASGATVIADTESACTDNISNTGGTVEWHGTGVDFYNDGGTSKINGTDAWVTLRCTAGAVNYCSTGTLTNAQAIGTGSISFIDAGVAHTITNPKVEGSAKIIYDPANTTFTNVPTGDGPKTIKGGTA